MSRKVLTAEEFFVAGKLRREWVPIPEWQSQNGDGEAGVYVTELSAVENELWEDEVTDDNGKPIAGRVMVSALTRAVVDETGNRLFMPEQIEQLKANSGKIAGRLYRVFKRLNVSTDADVEDAVKN